MDFRLSNDPRPTSLSDVFVRDVPLEGRRRIAEAAEADGDKFERLAELILLLFKEAIVDADGQPYANVATVEDVRQMGMDRLLEVQDAVMEALAPGKPSAPTGRSRRKSTSSSKVSR